MNVIFIAIIFVIYLLVVSGIRRTSRRLKDYNTYESFFYPSRRRRRHNTTKMQREENRKIALQRVQSFLMQYDDIMGNLCIVNSNCKVNIVVEKSGEKKILCLNKIPDDNNQRRFLTATISADFTEYYVHPLDYVVDNIWDSICLNFDYSTKYENISSALSIGMLDIKEIEIGSAGVNKVHAEKEVLPQKNLLNINTATEKELSSLPGVNVITAKKAIKYIEKNNGFKSIEEFFKKMKIKENFTEQIKAVTYVSDVNAVSSEEIKTENSQSNELPKENQTMENLDITEETSNIKSSQNERIIDL